MSVAIDAYFKVGAEVEVSSLDGSLSPATITGWDSCGAIFLVEYASLKAKIVVGKNKRKPLMEEVDISLLRPSPPREVDYSFELGDEVDAFLGDRWWEGVIIQALVLENSSKFFVYLRHRNQQLEFKLSELRLHREWVERKWVPPLQYGKGAKARKMEKLSEGTLNVLNSEGAKARKMKKFSEGTLVEVSIDEEGFRGSWYAATIVKAVSNDKYLVQYKSLRTDGDKEFLKEEVDTRNIRPYPPEAIMIDSFDLNEEVDALCNDGWWEGVICKVLKRGRYKVHFKEPDEETVFEHTNLRPRQNWINGTWVVASKP